MYVIRYMIIHQNKNQPEGWLVDSKYLISHEIIVHHIFSRVLVDLHWPFLPPLEKLPFFLLSRHGKRNPIPYQILPLSS